MDLRTGMAITCPKVFFPKNVVEKQVARENFKKLTCQDHTRVQIISTDVVIAEASIYWLTTAVAINSAVSA